MSDAKIAGCQSIGCCCGVDPGRFRVADQARVAGVLHHDDEDMLVVFEARAAPVGIVSVRRNSGCHQCHLGQDHRGLGGDTSYEVNARSVAVHQINLLTSILAGLLTKQVEGFKRRRYRDGKKDWGLYRKVYMIF